METPTFTTHEEVMFFDTDCAGVMHNIAYLRMIETCCTKLGAKLGFDFARMGESQLFPVVVRTEIDYRRPARLGDKLEIHGRLDSVERARFWCSFEMKIAGSEGNLVTCRQALALVQLPSGRPQRLPADLKEKWGS